MVLADDDVQDKLAAAMETAAPRRTKRIAASSSVELHAWKEDDDEEEYRKLIKGTRTSSLKAKRIVTIVHKLSEGNKKKQQRKIGLANLNHPLHRDLKYFIVSIQGLIYQNNDCFRR